MEPFFYQMVPTVISLMTQPAQNVPYPELLDSRERVETIVYEEERGFVRTLEIGNDALTTELHSVLFNGIGDYLIVDHNKKLSELEKFDQGNTRSGLDYSRVKQAFDGSGKGAALSTNDLIKLDRVVKAFSQHAIKFPGNCAFHLYETFGLPRDFIEDACRDAGITFDGDGFDASMQEAQARARASWKGGSKKTASPAYQALPRTVFEGYRKTLTTGAEVLAIIKADNGTGVGVQELKPGERGDIVLDHTTFYADAGGQVGDVGWLYSDDHNTIVAEVEGVTYPVQGVRAHRVMAKQPIHVGDKVDAMVNAEVRNSTMRNHTGTHLLHAALRNVLGTHVKQAGSLVDPGHLRFDFSHFAGVDDEQLQDIEDLANKEVLRNDRVEVIEDVPIDVAVNEYHAMALFGEKYGDRVRVITHRRLLHRAVRRHAHGRDRRDRADQDSERGQRLQRRAAPGGRDRRGLAARNSRRTIKLENVVATLVRGDEDSPAEALKRELERREEELKKLRKELEQARMKSASSSVSSATENVREVNGVKVLATRADNLERTQLRTLVDNLRNKLGSGVVVMGSVADGKVALIVGVTKDLTSRVQAGKIIAEVAKKVGGSGGGRPDMAEAGGKDPAALDAALAESYAVVEGLLK